MLGQLKNLNPAQIHAVVRALSESRAGVCAVKKLSEDSEEAEKMAGKIESCGLAHINTDLGEPMLILVKPLVEFAAHIQNFTPQLSFAGFDEPAPAKKKKSTAKREDISAVIMHYASRTGIAVPVSTQFYKMNVKAAIKLLSEAKSVERGCDVIDAVKAKMEKRDLEWTLNGAVLNHMHGFLATEGKIGKKGGWDW